ncbi:MAG: glycoside hydrolase family 13 protein, partial [Oscillospiraceae bacterium]|nr:glycoside hydrolase family 13 protein [Oscillospiraceae bacterium]
MQLFNSRDAAYKTPFGAVTAGADVTLTIRAPRALAVSEAMLCVAFEFDRETLERPMRWLGLDGDHDRYAVTLPTGGRLGPVWYYFSLKRFDRPTMYIGRDAHAGNGACVLTAELPPTFLQVVYDGAYHVPDWYGRGVTYHIFPDRFHRLKTPDPAGLAGRRTVHKNWNDTPDYLPDENGEIHNRDFFGGSLAGVAAKLPYLQGLGVTTLYFSPIFEAASNHRYDTADYRAVDPMLGSEKDFTALCRKAEDLGIRVMLDGVFNHTGYDSRYFNGRGTYPEPGAHQSKDSPYYPWYEFQEWPFTYDSWWGIYTLPQVNEMCPDYTRFIFDGPDSVIRHWLRAGASGWRLDVADELPDEFIAGLRAAARAEKPDAVVIGEVWEDATTKVAYDRRRRYLLGHELDGVMNYPLRNALLGYLLGGDAVRFRDEMESLRENYPKPAFYSLMNIIGTHDTPRALTVLGAEGPEYQLPREGRAAFRMAPEQRARAARRLKLGALVQFAFPG